MKTIKKSFALILALSIVFIMGMSTMSASALPLKKPVREKATATENVGEAKKREPILRLYGSYDVEKNWEFHYKFGNPPTTEAQTEPTVEETEPVEEITEPSVPLASAPVEKTVAPTSAPAPVAQPVVIKDAPVPKGEIPSTGDAGVAGVAALTIVSAAAFVIAKKK